MKVIYNNDIYNVIIYTLWDLTQIKLHLNWEHIVDDLN